MKARPDSLWRTTIFTRNPPSAGESQRLGWQDWGVQTSLLLDLRNLLAGALKARRLHGPGTAPEPQPLPVDGVSADLAALIRATTR